MGYWPYKTYIVNLYMIVSEWNAINNSMKPRFQRYFKLADGLVSTVVVWICYENEDKWK